MYVVTAALVVVAVTDPRREVYLSRGSTVPASITEECAQRLLERGLIAEKQAAKTSPRKAS